MEGSRLSAPAGYRLRVLSAITDLPAAVWDELAGPDHPCLSHDFLRLMEESGAATVATGWLPTHLVLEEPCGRLQAALPLYCKTNSRGEFVFDYGWAQACARAGRPYYPKLQVAVPFTPVPGPRLLAREPADRQAMLELLEEVATRTGVHSVHVTFCTAAEQQQWRQRPLWLARRGIQFHWINRGYTDFEDFLSDLSSRKRKNLRKERQAAAQAGLDWEWVSGDQFQDRHVEAMYGFYLDTTSRKWGGPALSRRWFEQLGGRLGKRIWMVLGKRGSEYLAGALHLQGRDALFGRYWGCRADLPFVHFELCYYQAIERAIRLGLDRVEAGAQGTHKLARGYRPHWTYSVHYLCDRDLRAAVEQSLAYEDLELEEEFRCAEGMLPFRRGS